MSGWKSKLSFLTPDTITQKVGGNDVKFYPISIGLAFQLRTIAAPLTKALTALFTNGQNDTGTTERQIANSVGTYDRETVIEPIKPDLADKRYNQRQKALEDLIAAFMSPDTTEVVGKILMDSMRDVFKTGDADNPPPEELVNSIPLPMLPDLLVGVAKANKGVFGPLTGKLAPIFARLEDQVRAKIDLKARTPESPTPTSSGDDSKTK